MKKFLPFVLFVLLLQGCSPYKESTGVWVNKDKIQGKSYSSIFVIVMTDNLEARALLENNLASLAQEKGYKVVKSMDVMPPRLKDAAMPSKEDIIKKVKESNADAVFVASLLKKEEDVRYTPGTTAYSMSPYNTWNGNFFGYYSHWYPTVYNEGYYTKEKNYFMQSNLYDVATEEIMWSVQSTVFDPSSLTKFSKAYTSQLIKQLKEEGLLK
jgi:hypothetical protein